MSADLATLVTALARRARAASHTLAVATTAQKDAPLEKIAALIATSHFTLLEAHQRYLLAPEPQASSYCPFGGGPRVCIGQQFALTEAMLALSMLVRRFDVTLLEPTREVRLDPLVTLRPQGGLPVKISRR